ncbi:MAG: transcriptional regulator, IclR family, partial [Ramlibacter sp.]|nr:transcriptional regulator, IclR family [Ramlibacter sp.]
RAVGRALEVLLAFREGDSELSASELLARVKLSRPTLYRLLYTLQEAGFVRAAGEPQRFTLGPAVGQLSRVWTAAGDKTVDLPAVAQPMMKQLWEETGETVALLTPDGSDRVCVAELPSAHALSFRRGVGHRERIMLGASGRTILAYLPHTPAILRKYAKTLPKGHGIDIDAFAAELERTKRRGWAVSRSELIQGAVALAAPLFAADGKVAGSLAVFGPSVRIDSARQQEMVKLLVGQAEAISRALIR